MADDLPTGRWRRAAKVGRLAGGQTARGYATKAANLTRSEDGRRDAAARRQMEAAEQIFEVLGQMKGAAMKAGQVASFIDTGAFPPEFQERIQAKLAELRDAAPRVPFNRMRKLIEDNLGEGLTDAFLGESVKMMPGGQPPTKSRFELLLGVKEHEMHHRGQLMLVERMIGIVPHLTRDFQERMSRMQTAQSQP